MPKKTLSALGRKIQEFEEKAKLFGIVVTISKDKDNRLTDLGKKIIIHLQNSGFTDKDLAKVFDIPLKELKL